MAGFVAGWINPFQAIRPKGPGRAILEFRHAALLASLGIGLGPFFDWFAGSTTMTILEVDPIKPVRLPNTVATIGLILTG